uniref:Uncharacterized protein n=1 Tax=Cacopsylla melanoneura TaxID=428564 RepID=A0A8D8W1R6_9HEMI
MFGKRSLLFHPKASLEICAFNLRDRLNLDITIPLCSLSLMTTRTKLMNFNFSGKKSNSLKLLTQLSWIKFQNSALVFLNVIHLNIQYNPYLHLSPSKGFTSIVIVWAGTLPIYFVKCYLHHAESTLH